MILGTGLASAPTRNPLSVSEAWCIAINGKPREPERRPNERAADEERIPIGRTTTMAAPMKSCGDWIGNPVGYTYVIWETLSSTLLTYAGSRCRRWLCHNIADGFNLDRAHVLWPHRLAY